MKELTFLQIENFKNNLIEIKNKLIEKFKNNNKIKKADKDYFEYEDDKFCKLKYIRHLFNQNCHDDDVCEEIKYLLNENGLEY